MIPKAVVRLFGFHPHSRRLTIFGADRALTCSRNHSLHFIARSTFSLWTSGNSLFAA